MTTINQLKTLARKELELSDDYIREFGPLTRKSTWEKAINNYQQAIAQETTEFVPPAPSSPSVP